MIALICLALTLVCYALKDLAWQGDLKWSKEPQGFWGEDSWYRKYKTDKTNVHHGMTPAPDTWYYRTFKLKYVEAFPLSGTALVFLTDGMHQMQFWMFNFLALSLTFAHGWNWYLFGGLMIGIRLVHWAARKLFGK